MIDQVLLYNKKFVEERGFEPYVTDKFPTKKLAVLTCMDTRLTELLPKALGLRNGDAKIIKNAEGRDCPRLHHRFRYRRPHRGAIAAIFAAWGYTVCRRWMKIWVGLWCSVTH